MNKSDNIRQRMNNIMALLNRIKNESKDPAVCECAENALNEHLELSGLVGNDIVRGNGNYNDETEETPLVLIIDDDETIREFCSAILGKRFRTETAGSCTEALAKLALASPALILLDIVMPETDGFGTLAQIRRLPGYSSVPVLFLTGNEDRDTEIRCLKAGAADFVRKPIVSEVLTERAKRIIELDRLQHSLRSEVMKQTGRAERLTQQIMLALSETVDAKDHYTHGHSRRVAEYSVEIARRMGKSEQAQSDIYAMGLLHDVGKIGVSEAIINKTSRLTDEEYAQIKTHTTTGYDILRIITEIPGLATGARWHHERYDGKGYPDGLAGSDIPEEARIICIADSYDAMTSNRSYSNVREQSAVRAEILRCKGSQFDPEIADIMIAMIDDDPEYKMSEQNGHSAEIPRIPHDIAAAQFVENLPSAPAMTVKHAEAPFIPAISELDLEIARKNISDEEILAETLRHFCELMPSKLEKLEEAFAIAENDDDINAYRIETHSVKGSSATFGLTALSEVAAILESMAKANDLGGIMGLHEPFCREWKRTYEQLSTAYREHDSEVADELPDGTSGLPDMIGLLKEDLEAMNIDAINEDIDAIRSFSYPQEVQLLINELKDQALTLDEDAVNETADKILKGLRL